MSDFSKRALINAFLGDGHFWRHPESVNSNIVWTSVHRSWLIWKQGAFLKPFGIRSRITSVRKARAKGCFPNARELFELKSFAHPAITEAHDNWDRSKVLSLCDREDVAVWYIDDGSAILRRDNDGRGYRIIICVGDLTDDELFPFMEKLYGIPRRGLGRVYKNNSRATERNNSWIIPKPVAVQILAEARRIAPAELQYKVPLW